MKFIASFATISSMNFQEKLDKIVKKNNSLLCIGLDPVLEKLPKHLRHEDHEHPLFTFNKEIIDKTVDFVCAYKPNSAFYEAHGEEGIRELRMTCDYLKISYPEIPIILDAKRGDIGNTNEGYVTFAFDYLQVDAITLNPYLGKESLKPFLSRKEKGLFILCKTSNFGSGELQDMKVDGEKLHQQIAKKVAKEWNDNKNCMLVVGAPYPEDLAAVRAIIGEMTLLVPGVGSQGGSVEKIVKSAVNSEKKGIIINSSRGIIYAGSGDDFADKAREEAEKLRNEINKYH